MSNLTITLLYQELCGLCPPSFSSEANIAVTKFCMKNFIPFPQLRKFFSRNKHYLEKFCITMVCMSYFFLQLTLLKTSETASEVIRKDAKNHVFEFRSNTTKSRIQSTKRTEAWEWRHCCVLPVHCLLPITPETPTRAAHTGHPYIHVITPSDPCNPLVQSAEQLHTGVSDDFLVIKPKDTASHSPF